MMIVAALALLLAACGGTTAGQGSAPPRPTTTTTASGLDPERMAHYREAVADMDCQQLADFEATRLQASFRDNREALTVIHDRQAALHCG
jgi:hypothetical protein